LRVFLKLVIFTVIVIGAYTLFASKYVPQGVSGGRGREARPVEAVDVKAMSPRAFVALGKTIFYGKGSCSLCHNSRGRAPLLEDVGIRAALRISEPGYRGGAKSAQAYIFESILRPSAYVVKGFGVPDNKGGEVSPMPAVMGTEIGLSEVEVKAVTAYLEWVSGLEVTVTPETPLDYGGKNTSSEQR